ncbi:Uncharacterized protein, UPF0303 family [Sphingobium sp. AP50]|uniref:heme-degrading domain-containing protein n=1 Tax=Sphingobium sp. AP50 TaxID=1884369 RepID=UPI0008BEF17B|nr:heme-degrading domain-containing protein [Sphingobium sp. AP50]SEJ49694.1 Uncharacterized protein, UPF0303 family [Sphingobium sp. AP50]
MTEIAAQIAEIDANDLALLLIRFTMDDAWALGSHLRDIAAARNAPVSIEIRRGESIVFATSLAGATSDNAGWASRKNAVVQRFERCSFAVALDLKLRGLSLEDFGLSRDRYAAAAGAVPIRVAGAGCIAAIAVSGLSGADDHALAINAIGWLKERQASGQ